METISSRHTLNLIVLDIETENTGADIMKDNKQIISVQIGNDTHQELYYADSKEAQYALDRVKPRIASLISQGYTFAGYNIENFDIPLLKQFLGIEISESNMLELSRTDGVVRLKNKLGRRSLRVEEVFREFGINADHKRRMNEKAEQYKKRPDIKEQAQIAAAHLVESKRWSRDFSFKHALDKIAGGHAIFNAYNEFVQKGGSKDTLFYEYAIGDVICEFQLLKILNRNE